MEKLRPNSITKINRRASAIAHLVFKVFAFPYVSLFNRITSSSFCQLVKHTLDFVMVNCLT